MATLHLICGLPGSGKSTLAAQLETSERALRLTPDVWMSRIVGDGYDAARREAVGDLQLEIAMRVLDLGLDVILEAGFWSRAERDSVPARAHGIGASVRLHYLEVSLEDLTARIVARNAALPPDTFHVEPADLALWWTWFEPPTADELA
jgi:predicted kinase